MTDLDSFTLPENMEVEYNIIQDLYRQSQQLFGTMYAYADRTANGLYAYVQPEQDKLSFAMIFEVDGKMCSAWDIPKLTNQEQSAREERYGVLMNNTAEILQSFILPPFMASDQVMPGGLWFSFNERDNSLNIELSYYPGGFPKIDDVVVPWKNMLERRNESAPTMQQALRAAGVHTPDMMWV